MSLDQIARIRTLVQQARERDASSGQLTTLLESRAQHLHGAIKLPARQSTALLASFVVRYIEQVPNFIEAITHIAQEAGIYQRVEPLLNIACDYFLSPPDIVNGHSQLGSLLDEAYLAHRLVEEVNDRYVAHGGESLIPMNNTRANLIVNALLGEEYANRLDAAVYEAVAELLPEEVFESPAFIAYKEGVGEQDRHEMWRRWPNMAEELGVGLSWRDNL